MGRRVHVIPDRGSGNLYHWLVYMISNLGFVEINEGDYLAIHVLDTPFSFHRYTFWALVKIGLFAPDHIIPVSDITPDDTQIIVPQHLNEYHPFDSDNAKKGYGFIRRLLLAGTEGMERYQHNLLISRRDSVNSPYHKGVHGRHIFNEDEVFESLKELGFVFIVPGEMEFIDQIRMFYGAKLIVSPHGSALLNLLVSPLDATVIEITPNPVKYNHFKTVASFAGINYIEYLNKAEEKPDFYDCMRIDVNRMLTVIGSISK